MLINFDAMEETVTPGFLGGEGTLRARRWTDELGKIMRGTLDPGSSIGYHTHETSSEIIYILSGTGKVLCDGAYEALGPGSCHYCPNDSAAPLEFLAVVPNQ